MASEKGWTRGNRLVRLP